MKILFAMLITVAQALPAQSEKELVKGLVDQFYASKTEALLQSLQSKPLRRPIRCVDEDEASCMEFACGKLGSFQCDDLDEIKFVGEACRGNYGSECLAFACDKAGAFACGEKSEIQRLARACVGNYFADCAKSVCSKLGTFSCDEISEIEAVLNTCAGN